MNLKNYYGNNIVIVYMAQFEHLIDPEVIKDKTVCTNFVYAVNSKSNSTYVFHTELPFKKFARFIDVLVDNLFTDIKEISEKDFESYKVGFKQNSFKVTENVYDNIIKRLQTV